MLLTWVIALLAIVLWATALIWYFWRDMRRMWQTRNDKWFRPD